MPLMFSVFEITPIHWVCFVALVLVLLALDLGVFHRKAREVSFKEAIGWTTAWFLLAMGFTAGLVPARGKEEALEFLTGYLIELSLSMDNVFVIALIFGYFKVPQHLQHRALFWGILGALVMRGIMIGCGAQLVARFHWILYIFGAFLVVTGIKMLFSSGEGEDPRENFVVRKARAFFPVTKDFVGQSFFVSGPADMAKYVAEPRPNSFCKNLALTPLGLVLIMVETTDLIFAIDSIPAIFAVTQKPFIVFTSNVFAILGLRSLYFVLAGAIRYFRYLKAGLSFVLIFIGVKMLLEILSVKIRSEISLSVVVGILLVSILASWFAAIREKAR